ncbi:MAG: M28 family peptidase [Bacillota bacterium]|jgi:hypothetical protein
MFSLNQDILDALEEISAEELMEHTRRVSSEVRLSGSSEEIRAFHYVQSELKSMGLQPVLRFHKALISLPGSAAICFPALQLTIPCITHSFSGSCQGLEGELFYLDTAGEPPAGPVVNLEGKIVLQEGIAMPVKVHHAKTLGAIGQIYINDEHTHEMIVSTVWGSPSPDRMEDLPSFPVVSVTSQVGARIREIVKTHNPLTVRLSTMVDTEWRDIPLMTADIQCTSGGSQYALLSGHIDSWHFGAMDNAAANATMLEVARILSGRKGLMRRNLRLAFWSGHSHGRYAGSTWYADNNWLDLHKNCVVHVNVDSTGGAGASITDEAPVMPQTYDVAREVIGAITGADLRFKLIGRAGDQSFWGLGIPSLFINVSEQPLDESAASKGFSLLMGPQGGYRGGGLGWWWHTTEDLIDKIDSNNLVRDTSIYLGVVMRFCMDLVIPLRYSSLIRWLLAQIRNLDGQHFEPFNAVEILAEKLLGLLIELEHPENNSTYLNPCLMELGKLLVPCTVTSGDPFEHDDALPRGPVPMLDAVRAMLTNEPGSDGYLLYQVAAVRKVNRLLYCLDKASELVQSALGSSKGA